MNQKNLDIFLDYLVERERIRLRRAQGHAWPWTEDPILREYKFTNVRRKHDRTSIVMADIYSARPACKDADVLMTAATFRYFGSVAMAEELGFVRGWRPDTVRRAYNAVVRRGGQAFTGAYIVPQCGKPGPKVDFVLRVLSELKVEAPRIMKAMMQAGTWRAGYVELIKRLGFKGKGFMAKEVLQDVLLMWDGATDAFSWTPVGPGARRGLNRVMGRLTYGSTGSEDAMLEEILMLRSRANDWFLTELKGQEPLSAHDIQWNLCELDKLLRVHYKEGRPRSRYAPPANDKLHTRNGIEVA